MIHLRVLEVAQARGISQGKLARMADLDPKTVSRICSGEYDMKLSTLEKLAQALQVHPCELLSIEKPADPPG